MSLDNADADDLALMQNFLTNRIVDCSPGKIVPEATLAELGIDSLMLVELLFEFEDKVGITISSDLPVPKTVGELLQQFKDIRSQQATK